MGVIHLAKTWAIRLRENANDGSETTNPDADYREVFMGEDGQLHIKDSAGVVTDVSDPATSAALAAHLADAADAHDASASSFSPAAGIAATDVQAAVEEVAGDVTTVAGDVTTHVATPHVTDHGALTGLADDDHPQYATDTDLTTHAATPHGSPLTVEEVDGTPTDSAVTKVVFPNGTLGIAAHVATYTPTGGSGDVATDAIWTTAGKVAVATGTATATEQWSSGHEFDYVQITAPTSPSATTEGTANTVITGNSVTYDGSTLVLIEFFTSQLTAPGGAAGRAIYLVLLEDSTVLGIIAIEQTVGTAGSNGGPCYAFLRRMPSAGAHTYTVKGYVTALTGTVRAGAGGSGQYVPAFLRVTKV